MAWIKEIPRKDGGITYRITWVEPGAKKESTMSVRDDLARAEMNVRLLDANGQSLEAVHRAERNANIGGITTSAAITKHINLLTSAGPDTIQRYHNAVRDHFGGQLGATPVAALEHADIVQWIRYMQNKKFKGRKLAAKTINNHHGLLSAAMNTAVHVLKLRDSNPCAGIKLPKDDATEEKMHFMTADVSWRAVELMADRYQAFTAFLRGSGARFGEATALRAPDFKLDAKTPTVRIERAWKSDGKKGFYIGKPKTPKSRRTISLPPSVVDLVRPLVTQAAKDGGYVFRETDGRNILASVYKNPWRKAMDTLGYPRGLGKRPRPHDMRHTHASLMLAAGMSIYELSRRLGHESIQTTIDRYSHLMPDAQFRGAEIAERALAIEPTTTPAEEPEVIEEEDAA